METGEHAAASVRIRTSAGVTDAITVFGLMEGNAMFESDESFWKAYRRLNALSGDWGGWQVTAARKEHEDLFGDQIKVGENYFKKQYGAAYSSVLKLSRSSMERVLFAVVESSPYMSRLGDRLLEREMEEMREAAKKLE